SARSTVGSRCRTSARRARSARSPSESTGSCRLLAAGGPQFRLGLRGFLVGRPDLVAGLRELGRDRLDLLDEAVERRTHPEVLAQRLLAAVRPDVLDHLLGVLALRLGLLAYERLDLVVADVDAQPVGQRVEGDL